MNLIECDFYEKILNKKYSKMIDTKINIETISMNSNSLLNTSKKDDTMKVYYPSLVSGEELTKDYNKEEIQCFANFNYNLKYINKYIKFKDDYINSKKIVLFTTNEIKDIDKKNVSNSQNKENIEDQKCNKDDKKSIISNIIKKFYDSCNSHIFLVKIFLLSLI